MSRYEKLDSKWIDEHKYIGYIGYTGMDPDNPFVYVKDLQNLLVPKQGELETKIQELIESYKQEEGAYSNPENGWISGFVEDLENLVEEKPLYYALIKGHELCSDLFKYWNCKAYNSGDLLIGSKYPKASCINRMTKDNWSKLGINESNADFVKLKEEEK